MSQATRTKYVIDEVINQYVLPSDEQQIVRVLTGRGNNLHEVETAQGKTFLVSMPTKFRKNVWIKKGDHLLIDPILEGNKVRGEIASVLYKPQIEYIASHNMWPKEFAYAQRASANSDQIIPSDLLPPSSDEDDSDEDYGSKVLNVNRIEQPISACLDDEEDDSGDSGDSVTVTAGSLNRLQMRTGVAGSLL